GYVGCVPSPPKGRRTVALLHPRHALGRIALALALGVAAGLLLSLRYPTVLATVGGWDVGGLALLTIAWLIITPSDAAATRKRAATDDPGRTAVYALTLLTSATSLLAATVLVGGASEMTPQASRELIALCLLTVAVSWTLTHTAFALRYAHLYYREDVRGAGGVDFPGGAPVPHREYARYARLHQVRSSGERPARFGQLVRLQIGSGLDEILFVQHHASLQPRRVRIGSGHDEQVADRPGVRCPRFQV